MACRITFTNDGKCAAMTLVEMMFASAIGSVVLGAMATLMYFTARSYASLGDYVDLDQQGRNTLDLMSREIRQADCLWSFATNQLIFVANGATNLSYTYFPSSGALVRSNGANIKTLLTGCSNLTFTIYARAPLSNEFDAFPIADAASAKLIRVDWTCSRQNPRLPVSTESVKSAKIVIRKQGN